MQTRGMVISLERAVREALEAVHIRVRRVEAENAASAAPEGTLWELGPKRKRVLAVSSKAAGKPTVGTRGQPPLIRIAEHISEKLGQSWIREGYQFADTAGNAHIDVPGLKVLVLGMRACKPVATKRDTREPREWRGAALRTLFHLLSDPDWIHRPVREIATLCNATPKTVMSLIEDLERAGRLVRLEGDKRQFHPDSKLVDRWLDEYDRKLRSKLDLGRFTAGDSTRLETLDPVASNAVWGAESAATRLGADLKPGVHTLYVRGSTRPIIKAARLRADSAGLISLRRAFWSEELPGVSGDTAPPLLVVADLMAIRDSRCYDAAALVRERYL